MHTRDIYENRNNRALILVIQSSRNFTNFVPISNFGGFYENSTRIGGFGYADAVRLCSAETNKLEATYVKVGESNKKEFHVVVNLINDYIRGDLQWNPMSRTYTYDDLPNSSFKAHYELIQETNDIEETTPDEQEVEEETKQNTIGFKINAIGGEFIRAETEEENNEEEEENKEETPVTQTLQPIRRHIITNAISAGNKEEFVKLVEKYETVKTKCYSMIERIISQYVDKEIGGPKLRIIIDDIKRCLSPVDKLGAGIGRKSLVHFTDVTSTSQIRDIIKCIPMSRDYAVKCISTNPDTFTILAAAKTEDTISVEPQIEEEQEVVEESTEHERTYVPIHNSSTARPKMTPYINWYNSPGLDKITVYDEKEDKTYYRLATHPSQCVTFKTVEEMNDYLEKRPSFKGRYAYMLFTKEDITWCVGKYPNEVADKYNVGIGTANVIKRNVNLFMGTGKRRGTKICLTDPYYIVFGYPSTNNKFYQNLRKYENGYDGHATKHRLEMFEALKRVDSIANLYVETFQEQTDQNFDFSKYGDQSEDLKWIVEKRIEKEKELRKFS